QRYTGQDKELKTNRLKLRNQIISFRKSGLSEEQINQEIALSETLTSIKSSLYFEEMPMS
ncbi:MAG: hypothetical protein HRT90_07490, partial [Candidatus Margulisbacteria bacterium]|nr:hypothetical protein [Candidatus Margulisiibacteriota bacterium]